MSYYELLIILPIWCASAWFVVWFWLELVPSLRPREDDPKHPHGHLIIIGSLMVALVAGLVRDLSTIFPFGIAG